MDIMEVGNEYLGLTGQGKSRRQAVVSNMVEMDNEHSGLD